MIVGIVSNSDKRKLIDKVKIEKLVKILEDNKIIVEVSPYMYEDNFYNKAKIFNEYFSRNFDYIIDVSGGDLANEILNLIDYEVIKKSKSIYMGYSDNTCIIDAIKTMTGKNSILYQARNIVYNTDLEKIFISYLKEDNKALFDIKYRFIRGESLEGELIGGNIRCLLKLVGLPYLPNFKDKILFLESLGGTETSIRSLFATMMNLNIFNDIKGLVLGNFTNLEENGINVLDLINYYYPSDKVLIKTDEVGHQLKSKALMIGSYYRFVK